MNQVDLTSSDTPITHQFISAYADKGYILIPLQGKVPGVGWREAPYELNPDLSKFPGNYGVALQADDLVIDVDPRNYHKDDQGKIIKSWKKLRDRFGLEEVQQRTFGVRTGGGGYHFYLKKPTQYPIYEHMDEYPGIEFKSVGRQVVGPGSIHPDTGTTYSVLPGRDLSVVLHCPMDLLEFIRKPLTPLLTGLNVYTDDEATQKRFVDALMNTDPAIEGQGGDTHTFKVACIGRDLGLSPEIAFELMNKYWNPHCQPMWPADSLLTKVKNAYTYATHPAGNRSPRIDFEPIVCNEEEIDWDYQDAAGQVKRKSLRNAVLMFRPVEVGLDNMLAFNQFSHQIEMIRKPPWMSHADFDVPCNRMWSDTDTIKCKYYLSHTQGFEVNRAIIDEAVINEAGTRPFHPIKSYLTSLAWDGVARLDTWLVDYAGAEDNAYVRAVGAKTLVAAVARVFKPGCKFDYMLILEGKQGIGKSQLYKTLAGDVWYADLELNPSNKDMVMIMRRKWIIEVAEMGGTTKHETNLIKAFITRDTDNIRFPYNKFDEEVPRQNIFVGTINPDADHSYLKDLTGNRRYWPVVANKIDLKGMRKNRDQIWAEAYVRQMQGEKLYLPDELEALAQQEQEKRQPKDPWYNDIVNWLESDDFGSKRNEASTMDIWVSALGGRVGQCNRLEYARIANVMVNELKWRKGFIYDKRTKKQLRGYYRDPNAEPEF